MKNICAKIKIKEKFKRRKDERLQKGKSDESERRFESGRGRGVVREGEGTVIEVPCEKDVGERCAEGMADQCCAICGED